MSSSRTAVIFGLAALLQIVLVSRIQAAAQLDATAIFESLRPSLCAVMSLGNDGNELNYGSGFAIGSREVVTNAHVVSKGSAVRLECSGRIGSATRIVRHSAGTDLVVLETDLSDLPETHLASGASVKPGAVVFVLGNPYGLDNTITTGLVSGIREIKGVQYLQLSADINPGNSGGPVVDSSGSVVGVATMGLLLGQGLNFALPIEVLSDLELVSLTFSEIDQIASKDPGPVQVSELAFRGLPLGSPCQQVDKLSHLSATETMLTGTYLDYDDRELNPHGEFWRSTRLLGEVVKARYECRNGILTGGAYVEVPMKLRDRTLRSLEMKYGSPTISVRSGGLMGDASTFTWSPKAGQKIFLEESFAMSFSLSYLDQKLLEALEHKEALKAIEDDTF